VTLLGVAYDQLFGAAVERAPLHALGWALLHFVWQGGLIALALAGVLALLRGRRPNVRYAAACAALALMLLSPALTFWRMSGSAGGVAVDETTLRAAATSDAGAVSGQSGEAGGRPDEPSASAGLTTRRGPLSERLDPLLPWLTCGWLVGVLCLTARALGGLAYARRLTRRENRLVGEYWQERLGRLSGQLRLTRPVRLLESTLVRAPATVGWLRPVILLPASAFTGLTPRQLELILAHELAHVRRHDYFVNLFQVAAETLLFYHPAVWWVSRQVRAEREHACDDLAVALCGDAVAYARALTKVERLRRERPLLAVAADGGELGGRIRRLVEDSRGPRHSSPSSVSLLLVAAFLASLAGAHGALSHRKQQPATDAAGRESSRRDPAPAGVSPNPPESASRLRAAGGEAASLIAADETAGEDLEVRRVALAALGRRAGAVVVMDPRTGRVQTVVNQEWAVRRSWSPASTIKLVTGAASAGSGAVEPAERVRVGAMNKALDLTEALARSDNTYFSFVGGRVGAERLLAYARELGLGERTGINYAGESAGILPPTLAGGDGSRVGAYGDGIEATPIQLATLVAAIANGGTLVAPRVPRAPQEGAHFQTEVRRPVRVPRESLEGLVPGMIAAVSYGTGAGASDPRQRVAGKTGTFMDDETPVGVFASYAPADDPRLVVVVVTRGREESGAAAAGVAGTIYRALGPRP
jgi:beta-lactamase regulating signal transducer with metallopeptidase domain